MSSISAAVVVVVLGLELGYAILEVAHIFNRGLPTQCQPRLERARLASPETAEGKGCRTKGCRTCRMASLCISPVQAGIMALRTANSSFILLRLRLSIKLWAVFLASLRPAASVPPALAALLPVAGAPLPVGITGMSGLFLGEPMFPSACC